MRTSRRKPVDWDTEIRKTERIRRRGLMMSGVSFALAVAVIFGLRQFGDVDVGLPRKILSAACLALAGVVLWAVMRHRARLKRERDAE